MRIGSYFFVIPYYQRIEKRGYTDDELPCDQTIANILNDMDYKLRKVLKAKPLKKTPETDEIFEALEKIHEEATNSDRVVRLSVDCKDRIKIGTFSRGGKSRMKTKASDSDFGDKYIAPFGILDVTSDGLYLSLAQGLITADFMVDRIRKYWTNQEYNKTKKVLVLNADNGPKKKDTDFRGENL